MAHHYKPRIAGKLVDDECSGLDEDDTPHAGGLVAAVRQFAHHVDEVAVLLGSRLSDADRQCQQGHEEDGRSDDFLRVCMACSLCRGSGGSVGVSKSVVSG